MPLKISPLVAALQKPARAMNRQDWRTVRAAAMGAPRVPVAKASGRTSIHEWGQNTFLKGMASEEGQRFIRGEGG